MNIGAQYSARWRNCPRLHSPSRAIRTCQPSYENVAAELSDKSEPRWSIVDVSSRNTHYVSSFCMGRNQKLPKGEGVEALRLILASYCTDEWFLTCLPCSITQRKTNSADTSTEIRL